MKHLILLGLALLLCHLRAKACDCNENDQSRSYIEIKSTVISGHSTQFKVYFNKIALEDTSVLDTVWILTPDSFQVSNLQVNADTLTDSLTILLPKFKTIS